MATAAHPVPNTQASYLTLDQVPSIQCLLGSLLGGQQEVSGQPRPPDARPPGPPAAHPAAIVAQAPGGLCVELQLPLQLGHVL